MNLSKVKLKPSMLSNANQANGNRANCNQANVNQNGEVAKTNNIFAALDNDGDGQLNQNELNNKAASLFNTENADKDGDGVISSQELEDANQDNDLAEAINSLGTDVIKNLLNLLNNSEQTAEAKGESSEEAAGKAEEAPAAEAGGGGEEASSAGEAAKTEAEKPTGDESIEELQDLKAQEKGDVGKIDEEINQKEEDEKVNAQETKANAENKVDDLNEELEQVDSDITKFRAQAAEHRANANSCDTQLNNVNQQIGNLEQRISNTNSRPTQEGEQRPSTANDQAQLSQLQAEKTQLQAKKAEEERLAGQADIQSQNALLNKILLNQELKQQENIISNSGQEINSLNQDLVSLKLNKFVHENNINNIDNAIKEKQIEQFVSLFAPKQNNFNPFALAKN